MLTLHTFIKQLQLTFVRSYTFVEPWDYKPKELNLQCQMPNWSTIIWEKTTMTLTRTMPNQSAWTSSLILSNCSRHGINQVTFFKKDSTVYFMACQIDGETMETVRDFSFLGLQNHCRWGPQPWNSKMLAPWKKSYDQPRQHIKKQRHYFANKGLASQNYGFSNSHEWMWELDYKETWAPKNWCFWTVVLEKTLESPLNCKEIKPV